MRKATLQLFVRLALLLAAVCTVFLLIGGSAEAEAPLPPAEHYLVVPGDTLWEIAAAHAAEGSDLRRLVTDIERLSGLDDEVLHPGQILLVPST